LNLSFFYYYHYAADPISHRFTLLALSIFFATALRRLQSSIFILYLGAPALAIRQKESSAEVVVSIGPWSKYSRDGIEGQASAFPALPFGLRRTWAAP
jgi:hypothetical protein